MMASLNGIDMTKLATEVNESNGSREYFHIVTRKSNGKTNLSSLNPSLGLRKKGKKRGRKPKVRKLDEEVVEPQKPRYRNVRHGVDVPSLMVNERERRKRSTRFSTYLEVLKGEKEFYIDDEEEAPQPVKRGRGRRKKERFCDVDSPLTHHVLSDGHLSLLTESIDEFSDRTCVIHVKESPDDGHESSLHASIEDGNSFTLKNVVQEILNLPSSETAKIISGIEQLGEKNEVLMDVMKEVDEVSKTEINAFSDFKEFDLHIGEPIFGITDVTDLKTFQISDAMDGDGTLQPQSKDKDTDADLPISNFPTNNLLSTSFESPKKIENGKTDIEMPEETSVVTTEIPISESDAKKFRCKLCSNTYPSFVEARQHAKTFHSSTVFEATVNKRSTDLYFKCPDCEREFPTEKGRNKHHLLMHLKNSPVQCPDCSQTFNSFRPLERHLREIHDRNATNLCDLCEEEFVLGTSLEHHISISHPPHAKYNSLKYYSKQIRARKRLFQCPLCNRKLIGTKAFRVHHEKAHNGEAFTCKQCKFKTNSATVLKRHLASVHKALDLSLYVCAQCKVGYQTPQDLEEHYIMFHNREATNLCPYCGEKFACVEMLRFHKGKHRAFPCDFCPIGFMKQETLEEHLNTVHKNDLSKEAETLFEVKPSTSNDLNRGENALQELNSVLPPTEDEGANSKILEIKFDGSIEVKENPIFVSDTEEDLVPKESPQTSFSKVHHLHNTKEGNLQEMDLNNPLKGFRLKDLPKKINCPICGKLLTTKFLRTHVRSHQGSLPHKCPKCSKAYAQGTLLRKHMKNRHYEDFLKLGNKMPKKKKVRCDYCELIFEDIYLLEEHLWLHMNEKNYKCETCRIKFGMKVNWMEHYKTHYFKEEKPCPNCDRTFKSVGYYREHTERCQSNWTCEECGFKCENPEVYRKHRKIEHTGDAVLYQCPHCEKSFYNKYCYDDHLITHSTKKQFTCHLCNKEFKRQRPLNEHMVRVHSTTKHICSFCSLSFDNSVELHIHAREHRRLRMECSECGVIYLSRQTLDNHMAIHHNVLAEDPFICSFCSEIFQKQIDLKLHLPVHSPDTPFVCQVNRCPKMFRKEALLRSHMARRHSYLEYFCHFCDRKFLLDSDLHKHVSTHKEKLELRCNKCRFTCPSKLQLYFHMCEHDEERPYECGVCGAQSSQKGSMILHVETLHNLQNPLEYVIISKWKCSVCDKIFYGQISLTKHLEQHSIHGVRAEGTLIKSRLSQSPISIDKANDILLNASNLTWEDLLPLLKVEVIAQTENNETGEPLKLATSTWQCSTCFFMTNTEENIKKHIVSSTACVEGLISLFTTKLNSDQVNSKICTEPNIENISSIQPESSNLQYIIVDNSLASNSSVTSKDPSLLLMENNLQLVMNGDGVFSDLLTSTTETANLAMLEVPQEKVDIESKIDDHALPLEVTPELLTGTGVLNGTGVLIQMEDGRLVIPELGTGVAHYQLVKEETDNHGTIESTYEILQSSVPEDESGPSRHHAFIVS